MEGAIDPIAVVTSDDPARHYAVIAAERVLHGHSDRDAWIAAHPDIVREVLENPDCEVRPGNEPVPSHLTGTPAGAVFGRFARMTDGVAHLRSRGAIVRALKSIDLDDVRSATTRLAEGFPAGDLDRFAFELPARVVGSVLGVPDADLDALARWTTALVECVHAPAGGPEVEAGVEAAASLDRLFRRLLRAPEPTVVVVTMGEAFQLEGLSTDHAVANLIGLLFQTHDATAGLIGNAIVHLCRQGGTAREPLDTVIERVQQQAPSVHNTRRFAVRDTSIAGQRVVAGDTILVVLAAAGAVDPDRSWTFGHGPHACPGRSLALVIAAAAVEELARRGAIPAELHDRVRYCPMTNVRIPIFRTACPEDSA